MTTNPTTTVTRRWRPFARHFLEMVLAMALGMMLLQPLWRFGLPAVGAGHPLDKDTLNALAMATDMTIGMGAWMRYRGHAWRVIAEMSTTMYLPFMIFFPLVWAGAMSGGLMLTLGHNLMLPAMLGIMLRRRDEYIRQSHPSPQAPGQRRLRMRRDGREGERSFGSSDPRTATHAVPDTGK